LPDNLEGEFPDDYPGDGPVSDGPGIKPWQSPIIPHSQKPKPIAFYWEFWGATLCANHLWRLRLPGGDYIACPSLPSFGGGLSVNIISGALQYYTSSSGDYSFGVLKWDKWASGEVQPIIGDLLIKFSFSGSPGNENDRVLLKLSASNGKTVLFYLAYGDNIEMGGIKYALSDNGGEAQTISLASYGLSGFIEVIQFESVQFASSFQLDLDYLTFPATL